MQHKLGIELFFFNAKTDYLPYYRNFRYKLEGSATLANILEQLENDVPGYAYPKEHIVVRVNNVVVNGGISVDTLVAQFGTQIRIEPASTYRATHDLCFDDADFMQKFELLEPFCDASDREFYEGLYQAYYASEALEYNTDYVGDALILLAHRLVVEKASDRAAEILEIVTDPRNGMGLYEYEDNSIPAFDLSAPISALNEKIATDAQATCLISRLSARWCKSGETPEENPAQQLLETKFSVLAGSGMNELAYVVKGIGLKRIANTLQHRLEGFNAAFYHGPKSDLAALDGASDLLACVGAAEITFSRSRMGCGEGLAASASEIAYEKAGNILLDAFDSNADLFIVPSRSMLRMFDTRKCSKAVGREIDIQVMSAAQLVAVALGYTDKKALGLDKSACNITLI